MFLQVLAVIFLTQTHFLLLLRAVQVTFTRFTRQLISQVACLVLDVQQLPSQLVGLPLVVCQFLYPLQLPYQLVDLHLVMS